VANPWDVFGIIRSNNKNDGIGAEKLARYVRVDPKLLSPITHRNEAQQLDLAIIRNASRRANRDSRGRVCLRTHQRD
jgi:transposase